MRSRRAIFSLGMLVVTAPLVLAAAADSGPTPISSSTAAGDDFDAFVNGAWTASVTIPPGKHRYGARDEIAAAVQRQLDIALDDAARHPSTPYARKVADFRAAYLDTATIDERGNAPLAPALARIARIRDRTQLSAALGRALGADVDPLNWGVFSSRNFLGLAVQRGIHGERKPLAFLLQGGLGLADRDAYLADTPAAQALRRTYVEYVSGILDQVGFDRADARAAAVLDLETRIARGHATEVASGDDRSADNVWSRADFTRRAPGVAWEGFFGAAGLAQRARFVVWQPAAIVTESALVASEPLDAWKDWLRVRAIDAHVEVLPQTFRDAAANIRPAAPRDSAALAALNVAIPDLVGRVYVDRWWSAATAARVTMIANAVRVALQKRVATTTWMDASTKQHAIAKLERVYMGIGHPGKWTDDRGLAIDPHDAFGNLDRVSAWKYRRALADLDRPVDTKEWLVAAHLPQPIFNPLDDNYNFPAAFLQPPKFDPAASDAANFGAIGAIFGHELSHSVDPLGADYEASGAKHAWWGPGVADAFKRATLPLDAQISTHLVPPGVPLDGKLSTSENVADLAGISAAFDAYRAAAGPMDEVERHRRDREFFTGFARAWRMKADDDAIRAQALTDHAPDAVRISTVRNLDAWYDAFDVRPGQRLHLAPASRVRIW